MAQLEKLKVWKGGQLGRDRTLELVECKVESNKLVKVREDISRELIGEAIIGEIKSGEAVELTDLLGDRTKELVIR